MDYNKIYDQLVNKVHQFIDGEYSEVHHKIPRSLGGSDDGNNLVRLTAREHYIAHLLLVKIYQTNPFAHGKMLYAFNCMRWGRVEGDRSFRFNSRLYQTMKKQYSQLRKERMSFDSPSLGKIWIHSVELQKSILVDKNSAIPNGWEVGRVVNWKSYLAKIDSKEQLIAINKSKIERTKHLYTEMYKVYCEFGFDAVKEQFDYKFSQVNFVNQCKKYVDDFKPQMGKKRG